MKLNPDCIRDLMLFFEDKTWVTIADNGHYKSAHFHVLYPALVQELDPINKYRLEDVLYHILQLSESGYISTDFSFQPGDEEGYFRLARVYYITPKGHEFIATIRAENSWHRIKQIMKPLGSVSLAVIESIASDVTTALINSALSRPDDTNFIK